MRDAASARPATNHRNPTILGLALLALFAFGLGTPDPAAATPAPESDPGIGEIEDDLQPVEVRGAGAFWVRPGVDLGAYDRVVLAPINVQYKREPRYYRIDRASTGVLMTQRDLERLQRIFYQAFKSGLSSGDGFGPASEPDPGLLWVSTSLIDVVVHYIDEPEPDDLSWIQDFGEMTLRVEFTDSETGTTVARFEERRTIGPSADFFDRLFRREDYSYWTALRANLARWSELVRRRMHEQRAAALRF